MGRSRHAALRAQADRIIIVAMTPLTNSLSTHLPLEVQLLCLPEALLGTVFSAVDVLALAGRLLALRDPHAPAPLSWRVWTPDGCPPLFNNGLPGLFASPAPLPGARKLIVIPALHCANAPELMLIARRYPALLAQLAAHCQQGGLIAACANGLIFPCLLGLLDGRRLDAHWAVKAFFARHFQGADFSGEADMSFDEPVYTCVAPAQQTGFMLATLGRLLDADLAQTCAQLLQHQPLRQMLGDQMIASELLSPTSNSPVFRAKQWLEANVEQPYSLRRLAEVASSSERTLLRHFRTALGVSPLEYLHGLRIERAKVMLEISLNNLQTIASACGYNDISSFRRMFCKEAGIGPGEYRKRFTVRTKRVRWRVETS